MKRLLHIVLWGIAGVLFLLLSGFGYVWIREWQPEPEEIIHRGEETALLPDTLTILTWNTGYAGLGDDMDFFMDGGKRTRTSKQRTETNLQKITEFLISCDADIILLQEVDRDSRRSYRTDQFAHYQHALPGYRGYFALNYKSAFVPVPLRSPMGRVESGVAIFSKYPAEYVVRHQYESEFSFPVRLFNLKRCWLAAGFRSAQGNKVRIGTTHNTAYDTGGMRTIETDQLYTWLSAPDQSIVGGDWNQTPPGYSPSPEEMNDPHFSPQPIPAHDSVAYIYDDSVPSVRYLYEPFSEKTTVSTLDFFLTSPGIHGISIETIDLQFKHSDHNPVLATFIIE